MTAGRPEIIDLTTSPSSHEILVIPSDEEAPGPRISTVPAENLPVSPLERENRKARRKKRKKSSVAGSQENTSTNTRENSVELGEIPEIPAKRNRLENSSQNSHSGENNTRKHDMKDITPPCRRNSIADTATDIFFVDVQPTALPPPSSSSDTPPPEDESQIKLLLPEHVSVLGSTPIEILPSAIPEIDEENEDFIRYLDYEDQREFVRYFEEQPSEESKLNRTVCKNCGAEGEHKTSACPVLICLTCGARNEHHTRSCPISKICFTCGMKGHINANCPNRRQARAFVSGRYDDCDRCGSRKHKTNECPTWWRLYEYLTEEERSKVISLRLSKKKLKLGRGGEGYVADDEWCYNCGCCGHWGDDCNDAKRFDHPEEPSAFSLRNIMSGPFYNPDDEAKRLKSARRQEPRDWENDPDDWGHNAPLNVGRQGKRKQMDKLAKKTREQMDEDDADDWFGKQNPRDIEQRHTKRLPKKLSFGKGLRDGKSYDSPASNGPTLLSRLSDDYHDSRPSTHYNEQNRDSDSRSSRSRRERDRDRDRDRNTYRGRDSYSGSGRSRDSGPRYKGGYSR